MLKSFLKYFHKEQYSHIWLSRTRNYKGERIEPPFKHYTVHQWNCISAAVEKHRSDEKWMYNKINCTPKEWLQKQGILNCPDLSVEKNYRKPFTCNKKCKEISRLIATPVYKGKIFYILQCPKFDQIFFFWE